MRCLLPFRPEAKMQAVVLCAAIAAVCLAVGWWPFILHPQNQVSWLSGQNGLSFDGRGLVYESSPKRLFDERENDGVTIELFVQPASISRDRISTIVTTAARGTAFFSIEQWRSHLLIRRAADRAGVIYEIDVDALGGSERHLVVVSSSAAGTVLYVDGDARKQRPGFVLRGHIVENPLVLGDEPAGGHSWKGRLLGLALFRRSIDANEARAHQAAWTKGRFTELESDPLLEALYVLDERAGQVAGDRSPNRRELTIPQTYSVLTKTFLATTDWHSPLSRAEWADDLLNLVGFVPFGLVTYLYGRVSAGHKTATAILFAGLIGALLSVTIEVGQAWLPARTSSMSDLVLNTVGALVGAFVAAIACSRELRY